MKGLRRLLLSAILPAASASAQESAQPPLLCAGYVLGGIADAKQTHSAYLEWRGSPFWHELAPYVFGSWRGTGASYVGLGLIYGIDLGPRWRASVSSGPGYFERDGDFDLGSRLEFASTFELSYRCASGRRLALGVGHVSNAGAGRTNPGTEFVRLGFQLPFPYPHR